ncbi:MAG: FHA domain-containing protein, partial [Trebonia sp.]
MTASWLFLWIVMGSAVSAAMLLIVVLVLGAASVWGLRAMGFTRDHPWVSKVASRPWRDGEDVLRVALRHLSDVFVITPSGTLLAPEAVELYLNPYDLVSLRERMALDVIRESVREVYEEQVTARGARFTGYGRPDAYVGADESVPPGRYRLRQGRPVGADAGLDLTVQSGMTEVEQGMTDQPGAPIQPGMTIYDGLQTIRERVVPAIPVLRLITGSSVAETQTSGARAGRGAVELALPEVPTVSRVHAIFTFAEGRWWIAGQGINGLTLNGVVLDDDQPL